jgi:hypothetical protein
MQFFLVNLLLPPPEIGWTIFQAGDESFQPENEVCWSGNAWGKNWSTAMYEKRLPALFNYGSLASRYQCHKIPWKKPHIDTYYTGRLS